MVAENPRSIRPPIPICKAALSTGDFGISSLRLHKTPDDQQRAPSSKASAAGIDAPRTRPGQNQQRYSCEATENAADRRALGLTAPRSAIRP